MTRTEFLDKLSNDLDGLQKAGVHWKLAATTPTPILLVEWTEYWDSWEFQKAIGSLMLGWDEMVNGGFPHSTKRCVNIDRLPMIVRNGCDVEPTDSVLWVDQHLDKVLEYGGDEKVMMLFKEDRTQPAYKRVPTSIAQNQLEELRKLYPTVIPSADGSTLSLSRLPKHDTRVDSYDAIYGRWIPGDPFEALVGIILFGREMKQLTDFVKESIAACPHPQWL